MQDVADEGSLGFADLSPELSRDFRGLRVWLPLMLHGVAAFREQLAEKLALARWAYDMLRATRASWCSTSPSSRSWPSASGAGEDAADRLGPELLRRVNARRRVFLSSTRMDGRYVLRLCVLSFRTHEDRVRDAVLSLGKRRLPSLAERSFRRPRAPASPAAARAAAGASGRPASRAGG